MNEDVVDMKDVLERVQDDHELLAELFEIFEEDYLKKRQELNGLIERKDWESIKDMAHSIKGAAGNISAKMVYATCFEIEELAEKGALEDIENLVQTLDTQFSDLQKFIKNYRNQSH